MSDKEESYLEITLKAALGNKIPSVETMLNIATQLGQISFQMAKYYDNKIHEDLDPNKSEDLDIIIGATLWRFLAKYIGIFGVTTCQSTPEAMYKLEDLLDKFLEEIGIHTHGQKNKNKEEEEENFFKENPDIH